MRAYLATTVPSSNGCCLRRLLRAFSPLDWDKVQNHGTRFCSPEFSESGFRSVCQSRCSPSRKWGECECTGDLPSKSQICRHISGHGGCWADIYGFHLLSFYLRRWPHASFGLGSCCAGHEFLVRVC